MDVGGPHIAVSADSPENLGPKISLDEAKCIVSNLTVKIFIIMHSVNQ